MPHRHLDGVAAFNRGDYFEAHEAWEDCWGDDFHKGLIHAAVALHHYRDGNHAGAVASWKLARQRLAPFAPRREGLDVDRFLADLDACLEPLALGGAHPPPFDLARAPRIELRP